MRVVVLVIALLFIGLMTVLTALDISHNGLSGIDVVAAGVLVLFVTGILGALFQRPPRPPRD